MYCEHFGLRQYPFTLTPDTANFYQGGNRGPILNSLLYAIDRGDGLVKVVGEVGSGKTMLCRMLESILPDSVDTVYLDNPSLGPEDLLSAIFIELGLRQEGPVHRLFMVNTIKSELIKRHRAGRRIVLLVEEAQNMSLETLEELRLLSNLETSQSKLLQIVLFGQPELDDKLLSYSIRQLRDRIVHSFYLTPLDYEDVNQYILHRLRRAGYRGPNNFSSPAIKRITRSSEGLLRRINVITDKVMLAAYASNTHLITGRHVRAAVNDGAIKDVDKGRSFLAMGIFLLVLCLFTAAYQLAAFSPIADAWFAVYGRSDAVPPAPDASIDLLSQRKRAAGQWLSGEPGNDYSIQVLAAPPGAETAIESFLLRVASAGLIDKMYVLGGNSGSHLVLYDRFSGLQEAVQATASLPTVLSEFHPHPRLLRSVRLELE